LDDSVVVHIDGDIDVATSDRLREEMSQLVDSGPNLVLDLNEVAFMDTIGISTLLATRSSVMEHGGSLAVRNPSSTVRRVLEMTGLYTLLTEAPQPE
jgi:anti-sigma B factor antagonist